MLMIVCSSHFSTRFTSRNRNRFLISFIYDLTDAFCLPDKRVRSLFEEKGIMKCFVYLLLTKTDSVLIQFIFVYLLFVYLYLLFDRSCLITDKEPRNFRSEMALGSKNFGRLNLLHEYFEWFNTQDKKLRKLVGLYEIETIKNPIIISVKFNPDEYYEHHKHKD